MLYCFWLGGLQLVRSVTQDDRCALARQKSGRAVFPQMCAILHMFDNVARPRQPMSIYVRQYETALMLVEVFEADGWMGMKSIPPSIILTSTRQVTLRVDWDELGGFLNQCIH